MLFFRTSGMTDYGIALHRVIRGALLCLRIDRMRRPSESEVSHLGNPSLQYIRLTTQGEFANSIHCYSHPGFRQAG